MNTPIHERDLEAALARLATDAVPDTAPVPAPPWQQQQRPATVVRRFGRATPWLVAAVILALAGLGVGAAVTFDAGAPQQVSPAVTPSDATMPATPDATPTTPTSVAPTPATSVAASSVPATSAAPPTNAAPPTGGSAPAPSAQVVRPGGWGPYTAGMTQAAAEAALGAPFEGSGGACTVHDDEATRFALQARGGVLVAITPPRGTTDAFGDGVGTTLAALRTAYPGGRLVQSADGLWVFGVTAGDTGLGFTFPGDASPTASSAVVAVQTGTAGVAVGTNLCAPDAA